MQTALLRLPAVVSLIGYQRSTIYQLIKNGTFPRPVKLGARASAWKSQEIQAWIDSRQRAEMRP